MKPITITAELVRAIMRQLLFAQEPYNFNIYGSESFLGRAQRNDFIEAVITELELKSAVCDYWMQVNQNG